MYKKLLLLLLTLFFIINLLATPVTFGVEPPDQIRGEYSSSAYSNARANTSKETKLVYQFSDPVEDVIIIDDRLEPYVESKGYDIKNISSEISGEDLWLNMSLYDLVLDDIDIYYTMNAGDSEVILFRGDGSISYADKTSDFTVSYSKYTISARINLSKLNYNIFDISGRVYRQGEMDPYGDYVISDDIKGEPNGMENHYMDPKEDVKISYTESYNTSGSPGLDVIGSELKDFGDELTITFSLYGQVQKEQDISYFIEVGEAEFIYNNGKGVMKYRDEPGITVNVDVTASSISVSFDKNKLTYTSAYYFITSIYQPANNKTYKDGHTGNLPFYLYSYGEKMDVEVSMFESEKIVIKIFGELSELYSAKLRAVVDELGNDDGNVEQKEVEDFISSMDGNFSTSDFFELNPYVDSVPGQSDIKFKFENATGNINSQKPVTIEIKGNWKYLIPDKDNFNITIRLPLEPIDAPHVSSFVFNFVYDNIIFKFSSGYKYWEFGSEAYPTFITEYLERDENTITIPDLEYYALNHRLTKPEFSFYIKYNQTLADLNKPKPKNGDDGGFLPGFESMIFLTAVFTSIIFYIRSKVYYRD